MVFVLDFQKQKQTKKIKKQKQITILMTKPSLTANLWAFSCLQYCLEVSLPTVKQCSCGFRSFIVLQFNQMPL